MKPVIAKRTTKCTYCKEPIVPGSERLTDKWRIKSSRNPKGYILITKHFHFRKPGVSIDKNNCFDLYAEAYFDTIPEENRKTKSNNPRGRPPLDLSEEDRAERRRLISKIHSNSTIISTAISWTNLAPNNHRHLHAGRSSGQPLPQKHARDFRRT